MLNENSWVIYPNPNDGKFTICMDNTYKGHITIVILSVFGAKSKILKMEKAINKFQMQVDLENFAPGSYILDIIGSDFRFFKLIVLN